MSTFFLNSQRVLPPYVLQCMLIFISSYSKTFYLNSSFLSDTFIAIFLKIKWSQNWSNYELVSQKPMAMQSPNKKYMQSGFQRKNLTDLNFNGSFASFCFITDEQNETLKSFLSQISQNSVCDQKSYFPACQIPGHSCGSQVQKHSRAYNLTNSEWILEFFWL